MSMTELERHLLDCLEKLQQEVSLSQENQDKHLSDLEVRQTEQEANMNQLINLFKDLESLLHQLNNTLQNT